MKKFVFIIATILVVGLTSADLNAKEEASGTRYRRSSLCSILINHSNSKYADEIVKKYLEIPTPEQFNEHNLSVRVINTQEKKLTAEQIDNFVIKNQIGSRLVARWFDRDFSNGACSMNVISERGLWDATSDEVRVAKHNIRNIDMLADAGEELIGNTYLLMNDITYVDKAERGQRFGAIFAGVMMVAGAVVSTATKDNRFMKAATGLAIAGHLLASTYKGFAVKVRTRLYRLHWDEETSANFYEYYYSDKPDNYKKREFNNNRDKFRMDYIGEVTSNGSNTSFIGINLAEPEVMVRKACQRAIEENIVELQKKYEQFRTKSPIIQAGKIVTAEIGIKDGVTPDSEFEVLEMEEKQGKLYYKRVGIVQPIASRIWDNRFMASEEHTYGSDLTATSFTVKSGSGFYPGMLIRKIR